MNNEVGKLEFNLEERHSREAFLRAIRATDMAILLHELQEEVFRKARKYEQIEGIENPTEDQLIAVERISEIFQELLNQHGINLDEILS